MADHLKKVHSGQPLKIPAATFNAFIDAAEYVRQQRHQSVEPLLGLREAGIVPIKNSSGADRSRFDILGINGLLWSPFENLDGFKNQPVLIGATPSASDLERFVILQDPVASGKIGRGLVLGTTAVQIDVKDASDDYADVIAGDPSKLRSQPYGSAWIVWKEPGTGTKWAYVVHGVQGSQFVLGRSAAFIPKGGYTADNVKVYRGTVPGLETWTSGDSITAYNRFGDIQSGRWLMCARVQRIWNIIVAEC